MPLSKGKTIKIVYYTGTGGTRMVAEHFSSILINAGYHTIIWQIRNGNHDTYIDYDMLILLYAVHACNAPKAVYEWLDTLQPVQDIPAVVISVSGGGEVIPNTACRVSTKKKMIKKGFLVQYEEMYIMPSNWVVAAKREIAILLIKQLPTRVAYSVEKILQGETRITHPYWIDYIFSLMGELEKWGAKYFGKQIQVSTKCNGCGYCKTSCPAGNITLENNKPIFGSSCQLCLHCIYYCPKHALKPGVGRFVVLKEGYNLEVLMKTETVLQTVNIKKMAAGFLWAGVRKYLLDFPTNTVL